MVAEDDDGLVGVELGVGAGGDFAHGHQQGSGEAGGLGFPGLADVEQERGLGIAALQEVSLGGDFRVKHVKHMD